MFTPDPVALEAVAAKRDGLDALSCFRVGVGQGAAQGARLHRCSVRTKRIGIAGIPLH